MNGIDTTYLHLNQLQLHKLTPLPAVLPPQLSTSYSSREPHLSNPRHLYEGVDYPRSCPDCVISLLIAIAYQEA